MLLSGKDIKLRIYLRTREDELILVELEREDLEKAAIGKTQFAEEQLHPIRLLHFELA
ncbi:hypothetical protein PMI15_04049 [Polaromonas sp. CF318]|jgi:hypothetical protein|uniref:hypothetical protein n=1 Tax=Polaromonas sp. CF318 TaxID=1144318 RepID=UPI0002713D6A|nr:hypothetical protein [Polaromonas sp. CF318]EJL79061.1 hypothetical protein PMI15_04049 [Polaromonas sp. CF318]